MQRPVAQLLCPDKGPIHLERGRDVALGLQPDKVEAGDPLRENVVLGQGQQVMHGRKRNVVEKANRRGHAQFAQAGGKGQEMVVVNPDLIVGAQFAGHHFGKAAVHSDIGLIIARAERHQIGAAVTQRPQDRVGVAKVIAVVFGLRQIKGAHVIAIARHIAEPVAGCIVDLARGAVPHAAVFVQAIMQRDNQPARRRPVRWHPVRDDDKTTSHNVSSDSQDSSKASTAAGFGRR